jgi:hypothetical protein
LYYVTLVDSLHNILRWGDPDELEGQLHNHYLSSSGEGMELVVIFLLMENHTSTNAIVSIDEQAAYLLDSSGNKYFPINLDERVEEFDPTKCGRGSRIGCYLPRKPLIHSMDMLWNETLENGTRKAFELQGGQTIWGYMVFEAPKGIQFRGLRWMAGDSLSIDFEH